ncbi:protein-glutamate O-methyltransferase CheR [Verrucomicrobium sp. GAS474]|uniref:CheR family methyltransferase n=1 Tax=Verrucomicrobium sp. GAS474 TaxID=1882831 RepID=UPI000B88EFBD|nr:protein-glutamate O-methyltransferase CheR [Verrucomicrobium sp. GAS474]
MKTASSSPEISLDPELPILRALVATIYEQSGYDFRDYAFSSLKRRAKRQAFMEGEITLAELRARVAADPAALGRLVVALTVHVTAMFRDPQFHLLFRQQVVPILKTYPFLRFWVAGCSTGEEVYSLAILLHEEGLYDRCRIYATDISDVVIERARSGIFPLSSMQEYTRNYQAAGGKEEFVDYYTADSEYAIFRPFLRDNVVFAAHNLASDASFNEFHVISCRNVMIYFNRTLQDRVHTLFTESLATLGYLGLGRSESLRFSSQEDCYEPVSTKERLYRKIA